MAIDLVALQDLPTVIDGVEQSRFRVSATLDLVVSLLKRGTPSGVVLDMIAAIGKLPAVEVSSDRQWGGSSGPVGGVAIEADGLGILRVGSVPAAPQGRCQVCQAALDNVTTGISIVHDPKRGNLRVCGSCAQGRIEIARAREV